MLDAGAVVDEQRGVVLGDKVDPIKVEKVPWSRFITFYCDLDTDEATNNSVDSFVHYTIMETDNIMVARMRCLLVIYDLEPPWTGLVERDMDEFGVGYVC